MGWHSLHPLFLEVILIFVSIGITTKIADEWRPMGWAILALLCLASPLVRVENRFRFYSLLFYWLSIYDMVAVTSGIPIIPSVWYTHPGFTGSLAMTLQIAYIIMGSSRLNLTEISFPNGLTKLSSLSKSLSNRKTMWVYYPFFFGVALFLYWRFSATLLTLLWTVEAFVVFVIGLYLREKHFRYLAMIALAACSIRLLAYDMAQSNLGTRGIVFIGVGLLMLGMNALNNKYKERFE